MVALVVNSQHNSLDKLLGVKIKHVRHQINCEVITIGPELAKLLLARNLPTNRRVSERRVERYAKKIELGEWKLSDPLKLNKDGFLFDGQHRLHAVVKTGVSVPFVVLYGYPEESMACVDLGAARSVSDIAKIEGVDLSPVQISLAVALLGTVSDARRGHDLTPQQRIDTYLKYQEQVDFAARFFGKTNHAVRLSHIRVAIAKALPYEDERRLTEFLKVLDTGFPINGNDDNAAIALRNIYMQHRKMAGNREVCTMLFCKALYAVKQFCLNKDTKSLRTVAKDPYPLID